MRRLSAGLVVGSAIAVAACGARSQLDPGGTAQEGGAPGTGPGVGPGPTTTTGGGGTGGTGGEGGEGGAPFDDCTDPDVTYIYLVTSSFGMYAFKPASQELEYRGQLNCPTNASPFSMAVNRFGTAYVIYNDGTLWQADVTDASCAPTDYLPAQSGFLTFGMGYALDDGEMSETLYVSDIDYEDDTTKGLGRIDTESFELDVVGPLQNPLGFRIELTGVGTDLFAFIIDEAAGGGHLAQVDKAMGGIVDPVAVPIGTDIGSWHFAFWGGEFYFFTSQGGDPTTTVRRYDPDTTALVTVGTVPESVVGAGASTCAPR